MIRGGGGVALPAKTGRGRTGGSGSTDPPPTPSHSPSGPRLRRAGPAEPWAAVWAKLAAWALDWTPRCLQRCSGTRELITHNEWGQ